VNWWRFLIMMSYYVLLPFVHYFKFIEDYKNIGVVFEFSNVLILMYILTLTLTVVGSCEDVACISECSVGAAFMITFNVVVSSVCVHFYDRLEQLSQVEEDSLLGYDVRREKLHYSLLDNIEELVVIKTKLEVIVALEVFLCVTTAVIYFHLKNEIGLLNTVINIVLMVLLSYRNFIMACSWNSLLEKLEFNYNLKFDKVKIKCYGVVVTERFIFVVFGSFLSVALRSVLVGN
jgi:hypothetical protein